MLKKHDDLSGVAQKNTADTATSGAAKTSAADSAPNTAAQKNASAAEPAPAENKKPPATAPTLASRLRALPLAAKCYAAAVLLFVLCGVLAGVCDTALYAAGVYRTQTITLSDTALYALSDFALSADDAGGLVLTSLSADPQLLLMPGQRVRTLRLSTETSLAGSELDLYYHLPGGGYAQRQRVWPTRTADGRGYFYTVPLWAGENLRLDLADRTGVCISDLCILVNEPQPWYSYVVPTAWQLFLLAVLPALTACALALAGDVYRGLRGKKRPRAPK